jgi:hypothetical protein
MSPEPETPNSKPETVLIFQQRKQNYVKSIFFNPTHCDKFENSVRKLKISLPYSQSIKETLLWQITSSNLKM